MLNLKDVIRVTKGKLLSGNDSINVKGVSIDSRSLKPGDLFIAIKGKNFDGHDFIPMAIKKRAAAIVVSHAKVSEKNTTVISVLDTTQALGRIARFYRDLFNIPVIAITGSTGKTTTKEMVATLLATRYNVLKNIATENNHIGVPMTLLKLNRSFDAAVVELGTNHFGEISWLTEIAHPDVAILTNIGESHLEYFKTPAGVFREKYHLVKNMKKDGIVIFNKDDRYLKNIPQMNAQRQFISYGINRPCDFQAKNLHYQKQGFLQFQVNRGKTFELKTLAFHNVYNALAAISCGKLLGSADNKVHGALRKFRFSSGRMQLEKIKGYQVINDTYNANPLSFKSAIETLSGLDFKGRKVLVCGNMFELGEGAKSLHRSVGRVAAQSNVDLLITIGKLSKFIAEEARKSNALLEAYHFNSVAKACSFVWKSLKPHDTILIKGSRGMHMEKIVDFIKKKAKG